MMPETKAFRANKANVALCLAACLIIACTAMQAQASDPQPLIEKQLYDLGFQAIAHSDDSGCVIQLVWINLEALLIANGLPPQPLVIYRSELAFPNDDGNGGEIIFSGTTSQKEWLDYNVELGVEYYYTMSVGVYGTLYFLSDKVTGSCTGSKLNLRATPVQDNDDNCHIALTWVPIGEPVAIYRSTAGFTAPYGQSIFIGSGLDSIFIDENLIAGERYFYTLVAGQNILLPEAQEIISAVACGEALPIYTEVFHAQNPYDLQYSQAIFRPVLEDPPGLNDDLSHMTYSDYEVTFMSGVTSLPVAKRDAEGFATELRLSRNSLFTLPLASEDEAINFSFPFFGKRYSEFTLAANGFITFDSTESFLPFNKEMIEVEHFNEPRIAFFNTELMPQQGGVVWVRLFDYGAVVTFENVSIKPESGVLNTERVTVQVELFYSGHIRITWQEGVMSNGLVGISDGRGEPVELSAALGLSGANQRIPFVSLASTPQRVSLEPLSWPIVAAGTTISFVADIEYPQNAQGIPTYYAYWSGPGGVPFTDLGNGTGFFQWTPTTADSGFYKLRIVAVLGNERVFQDLLLNVHPADPFVLLPSVSDLELKSRDGGADPRQDHAALAGEPLYGAYSYQHPLAKENPDYFAEGDSLIYWFKNGQIITAFTNKLSIPANVSRPGDVWYFMVTPRSAAGVPGKSMTSPSVTIVSVPTISSVEPAQGSVLGGDRVVIRGQYLAYPSKVSFGGIAASAVHMLSDGSLEVTTPPHAAGRVNVVVETLAGSGAKINAFRYIAEDEDPEEEKQKNIFGCGPARGATPTSLLADLIPALALLLILSRTGRKRTASAL